MCLSLPLFSAHLSLCLSPTHTWARSSLGFKNRLSTLTAATYRVECDWLSLTERHSTPNSNSKLLNWTWRGVQAFRRQREQASTPGKLERTVRDAAWCVPHTKAQIQPLDHQILTVNYQLRCYKLFDVTLAEFDTLWWVAIKLFCTGKALSYFHSECEYW